jgi:hypothetical protein
MVLSRGNADQLKSIGCESTKLREVDIGLMIENLERVTHLYVHEDNLNWRKLGTMVTFLFAFIATLWVVATGKELDPKSSIVVLCAVALIGLGTLGTLAITIESGLEFMLLHKLNARIIESQIKLIHSGFLADIWSVKAVSNSVRVMRCSPYVAILAWFLISSGSLLWCWLLKGR